MNSLFADDEEKVSNAEEWNFISRFLTIVGLFGLMALTVFASVSRAACDRKGMLEGIVKMEVQECASLQESFNVTYVLRCSSPVGGCRGNFDMAYYCAGGGLEMPYPAGISMQCNAADENANDLAVAAIKSYIGIHTQDLSREYVHYKQESHPEDSMKQMEIKQEQWKAFNEGEKFTPINDVLYPYEARAGEESRGSGKSLGDNPSDKQAETGSQPATLPSGIRFKGGLIWQDHGRFLLVRYYPGTIPGDAWIDVEIPGATRSYAPVKLESGVELPNRGLDSIFRIGAFVLIRQPGHPLDSEQLRDAEKESLRREISKMLMAGELAASPRKDGSYSCDTTDMGHPFFVSLVQLAWNEKMNSFSKRQTRWGFSCSLRAFPLQSPEDLVDLRFEKR